MLLFSSFTFLSFTLPAREGEAAAQPARAAVFLLPDGGGFWASCTKRQSFHWERCSSSALHPGCKACIIQTVQAIRLPPSAPAGRMPAARPEGAIPAP